MLTSPLQTSSSTNIDDRSLRMYIHHNSTWNLDENEHIDHCYSSSNGIGEKFLNSSVHFPNEMRSMNLNQMVSNIVDENNEIQSHRSMPTFVRYQTGWINGEQTDQQMHFIQQMKTNSSHKIKFNSSTLSESGHPRNIPDSCANYYNPPKDIQVLIRKGDHTGINSLIKNVTLQQFRQMIGLQRSSGLTTINDRKNRQLSLTNNRHINAIKQQENMLYNQQWSQDTNINNILLQQQIYLKQHSSISSHDPMSMSSTIKDTNLTSPVTTCQDIRRTGIANTLHIAIEKCYEQLNYIRDSYAETESKLGIQILHKSPSLSMIDITNSDLSNNPSRVDRLIIEYHHEYNRIIHLHDRIKENLSIQDIEANRQTLDEWLNAINIVQDRRRQEIDNATEKCRSGELRLPDEKDVLQLAESLRILRITTRKIRTVLWYWLYWSTNSTINKIPLIARHQDESILYDGIYSTKNDNLFYLSNNNNGELFDTTDEQRMSLLNKKSNSSKENNKENQCNE